MVRGLPQAFWQTSEDFLSQSDLLCFEITSSFGKRDYKACNRSLNSSSSIDSASTNACSRVDDKAFNSSFSSSSPIVVQLCEEGKQNIESASTSDCSSVDDNADLSARCSRSEETDAEEEEEADEERKDEEDMEQEEEWKQEEGEESQRVVRSQQIADDLGNSGGGLAKAASSAAFRIAGFCGDEEKLKQDEKVDGEQEKEQEVESHGDSDCYNQQSPSDGEDKVSEPKSKAARTEADGRSGDAARRTGAEDVAGAGEIAPPPSMGPQSDTSPADPPLAPALAHVLSHLITVGQGPREVTPFHGVREPPLSIQAYLERIVKHTRCSDECLILCLVYIDRMAKRNPEYDISGKSIHRLILVSVTLAIKFYDDTFYSNPTYARVGGLKIEELNKLEQLFFKLVGWRLHVMPEEYEWYRSRIHRGELGFCGDEEKLKQDEKVDGEQEKEQEVESHEDSDRHNQQSPSDGEDKVSESKSEAARAEADGRSGDAARRAGAADVARAGEIAPPPSMGPQSDTSPADPPLAPALAHVLSHLITEGQGPREVTPFHGARVPPLSIQAYLERIVKHTRCSDECLVLCLVYIDRMAKRNPEYDISGKSIHRLILVSVTLAIKFYDDTFYHNSTYARVGGLNVEELNKLEQLFFKLVGWRLHVMPEEYEWYRSRIHRGELGEAEQLAPQQRPHQPMHWGFGCTAVESQQF